MVPKFANPHTLVQDVEKTTRSDIAKRAGFIPSVRDEDTHALKRDLDASLRDTWADTLAETSHLPRGKKHRNTSDGRDDRDEQIVFRLLSTMKQPQHISLDPKRPHLPVSRPPDCEDDETEAETRRIRSLSVAVEIERLGEAAVLTRQLDIKPVIVGAKVPLTETTRARRTFRRRGPQARQGFAASPHAPRPSCVVLPVTSVPNQRELSSKKYRKPVRERPPPAYWRPSPGLRGACLGYALGYPSSWAPNQLYVPDTMKRGVESTLTHAVHDNA
ncbi:hypothetical protein L210DRAFT_3539198 [Boletus edulis BED1]|uniref:Uncharacterized protein n=1 Tax=Boletus edulis BED1 TaxID=1328754 RepID=A0AAD4GEF9_BOLED|nr:hypothetical protein L210DRAFT_3539198 [Boletus edulis BED1]